MARNNSVQVFEGGWKQLENAVFTDNQVNLSPAGATNSFTIKPDGTELYVLETDKVKTFPLSIPYDPNSLGAEIRSFEVTQDAFPIGLNFRDDGTQMFVGGQSNKIMISFTLPVPFDTSSIVDSPTTLSLTAITGVLRDSTFSRDGDFLFTTSQSPTFVHRFPLPTPWDITSNVSNTSFDPLLGTILGIEFKPQGDKMYIIDITADKVVEFDLSTIYDITTAVPNGNIIDFAPASFSDIEFRSTGKEILFIEPIGIVTRFHVDQEWDISTASFFINALATVDFQSIFWKPDGTLFFGLNSSAQDRIDAFTIPERWNQSSNTGPIETFALAGIANTPRGIWVSPDGKTCMVIDIATDSVVQLDMSTGWDITTMSNPGISFDLNAAAGLTAPSGITFTKDLLTFYVTDSTSDDVFQFTVPTPLDIANATFTTNVLDLSSFGDITDTQLKPDGKLIYFSDNTNDKILLFSLPADGNISNAVFLQDLVVTLQESNLRAFFIRENDGKKIWVAGQNSGNISSLDMTLEFNNSLITEFGDELVTELGENLVYV